MSEETTNESAMLPRSTRLFQISETNLSELESLVPELLEKLAFSDQASIPTTIKIRRVKHLLTGIRWAETDVSNMTKISADDLDDIS